MVEREEDLVRRLSGGFAAEERAGMSGEDQRTGNAGDAPLDVFESPSCVDCGLSGCADGSGALPVVLRDGEDLGRSARRDREPLPRPRGVSHHEGGFRRIAPGLLRRTVPHRGDHVLRASDGRAPHRHRLVLGGHRRGARAREGLACQRLSGVRNRLQVGAIRRSEFGIEESCCDFRGRYRAIRCIRLSCSTRRAAI